MGSEAPNKPNQSIALRASLGSLQNMNLGALVVGQLAQSINWSNEPSFKKPDCKPWVELPGGGVEAPASSVSVKAVNEEVTKVSSEQDLVLREDSASSVATIEAPVLQKQESAPTPEEVSTLEQTRPNTEQSAQKTSVVADEGGSTSESHVIDVVDEDVSEVEAHVSPETRLESSDTSREEAEIEVISAKVDVEDISDNGSIEAEVRPSVDMEAKDSVADKLETASYSKEMATNISEHVPEPKMTVVSKLPREPIPARLATPPTKTPPIRPSVTNSERLAVPVTPRVTGQGDSSQGDYLLQLERLVVELNMELARVRGEHEATDPIEQMANRILALNLENLALREKLQQSNP